MAKVLIVDDDVSTQTYLTRALEGMGHATFISPNGRHAFESLLANNDFELLIVNVILNEMDGPQLIQLLRGDLITKIKGNSSFRELPIIAISAIIPASKISNILMTGADYFLSKPIHMEELVETVGKCLKISTEMQPAS
ncbi:MAG: response regulator [Planctomycetes bacterium]|nr:response regulator [Planctomycetota bacterium]